MFRRYAFVRQHDQTDCGAAALATVAARHGVRISLQRMRDLAGTDRVGTNVLGLLEAAEKLGFTARAVHGEFPALSHVPLPAIAHAKTSEGLGHFLVVHEVKGERVVVADPARGIVKLGRDEFCRNWTGYLVLLVPRGDAGRARPAEEPASPWRRFVALLLPHRRVLAEAFFCAVLLTLLGLSTSFFIRHLVDSVLVHDAAPLLNALGIGMLAIVLFRTLFSVLRQYLLMYVGRKLDLCLVSDYMRHVLRLPLGFFELRRVGEILSRVNDAVKVRAAVSGTSLSALVDGTLVVVSLLVMFLYDWQLALLATLFIPALAGSVIAHHPGVRRLSREAMEKGASLQSHMIEDVSGIEAIKGFGTERHRSEEGDRRLTGLVQAGFSLQILGLSLSTISMLVKGAAGIAVLWYGGHRVFQGALSVGELMFFHTLLGYMLEPLERLASVNLSLQEALVAIDRLYQVLDVEVEKDAGDQTRFEGLRQGIRLRGVSFRYGCRANVLDGIDLEIPAGKKIAIVGESGSGKSTLLKLLLRYYEPTAGAVLFDGADGRDLSLSSLRARVGVVSQEPFIFNGTVRENIALGKTGTTAVEVAAAARAAGLQDFIEELPERYETVIGERGVNLSGGQRQRLAIARALLQKPEILILDEATSHLDTATELAIQKSMKAELAGKTVILVAHRLSTVRDADVIYLLERGRVAEQGSHAELLARGGRYADLWRAQMEQAGDLRHLTILGSPCAAPFKANGKELPALAAGGERRF